MSKPSKEQVDIALECLRSGVKELFDPAIKALEKFLELEAEKKPAPDVSIPPYGPPTNYGYTCWRCATWVPANALHNCNGSGTTPF